jgi:hypothetical protein
LRSTGIDAHADAGTVERREPRARLLRAVEPRQLHEGDHVAPAAGFGALAVALQRLGSVLARLAGRDADLDQLPVREQAQRLGRAEQAAPVEVAPGDGVDLASRRSRRRGQRPGSCRRLPAPAGLVSPDRVERPELALEVRCQLLGPQQHQTCCTEASRRRTWDTMSACMAR